jgi:hypothetical protein
MRTLKMAVNLVTGEGSRVPKINPNIRVLRLEMECRNRIAELDVLLEGNLGEWQKEGPTNFPGKELADKARFIPGKGEQLRI